LHHRLDPKLKRRGKSGTLRRLHKSKKEQSTQDETPKEDDEEGVRDVNGVSIGEGREQSYSI